MKRTRIKSLVVGDGWSALGTAAFLLHAGEEVVWLSGTGTRLIAPVPGLEVGPGVAAWRSLTERFGIEAGEIRTGTFVREFRNKSFREPAWAKAPTPEMRREVRDEVLWAPEAQFAGSIEARFDLSLADIEDQLRIAVIAHPKLTRLEGAEIQEIHSRLPEDDAFAKDREVSDATKTERIELVLGTGEILSAERVFYADRWSSLIPVQGIPKPLPFLRNRKPVGALQAMFTHEPAVAQGVHEGFFGAAHKDAGEEFTRNVWGHFFAEGRKSVWTFFLEPDEAEDNHELTKKLRRVKQACERMFGSPEWLGEGNSNFGKTVASEQLRFEEGVVYTAGEAPSAPLKLSGFPGLYFLTDAYGPSRALEQVRTVLGEEVGISELSELEIPQESGALGEAPLSP